ncbi:drug metabolite transporter superfamily [Stylonychia lemnae]|uniref:Drug metabolite transporter superfamily n=1 Tax=Stylonychia lemnae TaxID=5949 RepID=A0A078B1E1_STYLE|nr:drug metabolite transporter superfamily [Stylonychia lemnae]|eukprot:CDW88380.1 drug metabolite transporter superfamily [Stylonychia lemnae]
MTYLVNIFKDKNTVILAFKAAISLFLVQITYLISGQYTIISHATILSSLGGAIIVVLRFITKQQVHKYEYLGILLAMIGCVISVFDEIQKVNEKDLNIPLGDISGLLCSIFMVIQMNCTHELIQKVPTSLATLFSIVVGLLLIIAFGLLFDNFTFDMNMNTGIFGFCNSEYFLYTFFILGFFTGAVAQFTEYQSLKYFSPLIVINFLLFEPIISQFQSCWLGIDQAPGEMTYIGGLFTLLGIFFVSYGGQLLEDILENQNNQKISKGHSENYKIQLTN